MDTIKPFLKTGIKTRELYEVGSHAYWAKPIVQLSRTLKKHDVQIVQTNNGELVFNYEKGSAKGRISFNPVGIEEHMDGSISFYRGKNKKQWSKERSQWLDVPVWEELDKAYQIEL